MAIVTWDGSLSVGIDAIDSQHKHLFQVINNLQNKMRKGDDKVYLTTTLDSLQQYIRLRVRTEEDLMKKYGYPARYRHESAHLFFSKKIKDIENRSEGDVKNLLSEILGILLSWIVEHIQTEDMDLASFLESNGAIS